MPLSIQEWTDQASWDAFVASQACCHYNQGWAWGEAAEPLGGKIFRFAVLDTASAAQPMVAAMSVGSNPIRRSSFTQLFVSRGPTVDQPTDEMFALFSQALAGLARREKAITAKLEPQAEAGNRIWTNGLVRAGFAPIYPPTQPRSTWLLDVTPDLDTLLSNMKPKWRYNIRLAEKRGVEIVAAGVDDVADFYDVYQETSRRDHFYIHPRAIYEFIFNSFWRHGQGQLLLARYEGRTIAGVSLVHLGPTVWYLYGASSDRNREVMAPHLLQWSAIQWAKERGASTYDFRGVPDVLAPGQEMYGVYRFKQGFGGRQATYLETYAKGYQTPMFQMWKTYWQGRYLAQAAKRRIKGEPHRAWA